MILILIYLNKRNLTPFFDEPETSHLLLNSNLDPDTNFFTANSQLGVANGSSKILNLVNFSCDLEISRVM